MPESGPRGLSLKRLPPPAQWGALALLSLAFALAFDAIRLPAALLLGAMLAAILVAILDGEPRVTRKAFTAAQGVVGCLVARGITPEIVVSLRQNWPLFVSVTLLVILACGGMGWILARREILPGTTAVWACSPGGASVMTLMSDDYGGDMRLVAVMQYLRVVIVTVAATVVAHFCMGGAHPDHGVFSNWGAAVSWADLALTLLLAGGGSLLAWVLKIPGGPMLVPMALGSFLQTGGWLTITLPPWILTPAYVALGWSIGLRFTRPALYQAARALPAIFIAIVCLILACAGIALALTRVTGIDPLTAYLATSPGGMDAVAIIAATSGVNIPFVLSFQVARLLLAILIGPPLARFLARRLKADER